MAVCAKCGADNREEARFCDACGAPLTAAQPLREVRKTVTVLFCDVTGSTALGERLDPESLRRVMARYFEAAKQVVERHGGTVEKFIGDAVMAVFGVPAVHEDDALRAVRASEELRGALAELNEELAGEYGTRLELRTGVNTGEVVTGTAERLATGDAVNVAARLEQAAQPGEVLLGEETYRLVRDAVEMEPVASLELKGKAEAVPAFRLLSVRAGDLAITRRHGAPMVGRDRQRQLLVDAFANVVGGRTCHLFTILGPAGVGKSRLVTEFLGTFEDASVVSGRCLSYGEGISYWPVTEAVLQLLGDAGPARLTELELDVGSKRALSSILGDDVAPTSADDIAWAVRKLLETAAAERPLVVVFDDIHWGEPTFLDLVEHIADFSRDAPILLICMARAELFDRRPAWGGGKLNATTLQLEPLAAAETEELIVSLLAGEEVAQGLRTRILESAGGNPLFVEEMVAMVSERESDAAITVPPTIQALLAARLDQLEPAERGVLECGAVEGQVFHRGAVAALGPDEREVSGRLMTLVRKDLVRPDRATLPGDEAFRFRHLLVRDTAYESLPKATRGELHERFAVWLEEHGSGLVELDELVGYHLEQAYRYRTELGPPDESARALAPRAGERLYAAGRRARLRVDMPAAQDLLARAVALLPAENAQRPPALLELGLALTESGAFEQANTAFEEAASTAALAGDARIEARATLGLAELGLHLDPEATMSSTQQAVEDISATLERLGDDEGLVWAWRLTGNFLSWQGRNADADAVWARAVEYARRAGDTMPRSDLLVWPAWTAWYGPVSVEAGLRRCQELVERADGDRQVEAVAIVMMGILRGMQGEFEEARAAIVEGRAILEQLGSLFWTGTGMTAADLELMAGDAHAAEEVLRPAYEQLREHSATGYLASGLGFLAQTVVAQGRDEEALRLADETAAISAADDFDPHARHRLVRAIVLARRGEYEPGRQEAQAALALVEPTDCLLLRIQVVFAVAEVERAAGDRNAEATALEEVLRLAELKGDLVAGKQARTRLDTLGVARPA